MDQFRFIINPRLSTRKTVLCLCVAGIAVLLRVVSEFSECINENFLFELFNMNGTTTSSWYYIISTLGIYNSYSPIVNTTLGSVRGVVSVSRERRLYNEVRAIPYAKPPIGDLRFEPPVPAEPWKGLFTADKMIPACLQFDAMIKGEIWGEEDCLKLNVFSPNFEPNELMPTLMYIHGGGFTGGESSMFNPKYIMDHDIVVVTFNYRLASLGFLNTGDELIRGNMGLKDQNLALRWIRDNIKSFGGDPSKVTLMGESAGGASAHYHVISPLSRGLFRKAIIQSGNLGCPWSFTRNPRNQALKFGKQLNCPVDNTSVLVDCLKRMDSRDIVKPHVRIMSPVHTQDDFFPGSVEAVKREDTFLSENPYEMLMRGDFNRVPFVSLGLESYPEILAELDEKWNIHVPVLLHYDPNKTEVSDKLREYYFTKREEGKTVRINPANDLVNLTKMLSAGLFFEGNNRIAKFHAQYAPTYLYYYTYISKSMPSTYPLIKAARPQHWYSPWEINYAQELATYYTNKYIVPSKDPKKFGAIHGDDVIQVFSMNFLMDVKVRSKDFPFSKELVKTIVQFASDDGEDNLAFNGVPWPAMNPIDKRPKYMQIDKTGNIIEEPFTSEVEFIQSLNIRDPREPNNW